MTSFFSFLTVKAQNVQAGLKDPNTVFHKLEREVRVEMGFRIVYAE